MSQKVIELSCPGCGAPATTGSKKCSYCKRPIVITTFNSMYELTAPEINKYVSSYRKALAEDPQSQELNHSVAMCYLRLKMYDKALDALDKAMVDNFDNPESFFYAAVCVMKGKKAFLLQRADIDRIEEYINAALTIEPRGIFYYFLAYIKYDYYSRKFFKTTPTWQEALAKSEDAGLSATDVERLFEILGVERPNCL